MFVREQYQPKNLFAVEGTFLSAQNLAKPYRYGFNGMEKDDEVKDIVGSSYDFGARIYDPRVGRWLTLDPQAGEYPHQSDYIYVSNVPTIMIDPTGKWDIVVHAYKDREKHGYGIAIVKNRSGEEIQRFVVRLEGAAGRDRTVTNADTPLGVYDIPDEGMWLSGGSRASYGPNHRLVLNGESGEIKQSGRDLIRIHGGRQEKYDPKTKTWTEVDDPELKITHGCLRALDEDVSELKKITDKLKEEDDLEIGGKLTIKDDLVFEDGKYYVPGEQPSAANKSNGEITVEDKLQRMAHAGKRIFTLFSRISKALTGAGESVYSKVNNVMDKGRTDDEVYGEDEKKGTK